METLVEERGELIVKTRIQRGNCWPSWFPNLSVRSLQTTYFDSLWTSDDIAATLDVLVSHPDVRRVVQRELDQLQPESQMFVDPLSAAVVLGALVVFLQTKFDAEFSRKDGKASFKVVVKREAASDKVVEKVIDSVRNVIFAEQLRQPGRSGRFGPCPSSSEGMAGGQLTPQITGCFLSTNCPTPTDTWRAMDSSARSS